MMLFDWSVHIGGVDVSSLVKAAGRIEYGERTRQSGFSAPVAVFDMFTQEGWPQYAGAWPAVDLNMPVLIHVTWDGTTQWRRFTGKVQAIDHDEDQRRITATGTIARLAYFWTGGTSAYAPRSAEQDADRVAWMSTGSDPAVVIEAAGARWLREIPANQPNQPLLDQLLRIADDCDGRLMQDRLGVVRYRTRNFTTPPTVLIPEFLTERDTLRVVSDMGTVCNSVDAYFGEPHPDSGLQPHVHHEDGASIAAIGERRDALNTDLIWYEDAAGKAIQYVDQREQDWTMPDVTLLMNLCTGPVADDVLDLQIGWPVTVATLPPGAPMAEYDGQIIGTTEVMHQTDYRFILHLAPFVNAAEEPNQDPIYPDGVITGYDSTGTIAGTGVDVGKSWRWCKWTTVGDGSITNDHDDMVWVSYVGAAGGGGGGAATASSQSAGGGGGAGGLLAGTILVGMGTQPITIGDGGPVGSPGTDSYILGATLQGGGNGGYYAGPYDGADGGSGGGTAFNRATMVMLGVPGSGVDGQGWPGYRGGGGARERGSIDSDVAGGSGYVSDLDGTSREYGAGGISSGSGGTINGAANTGSAGSGGTATVGPGAGGTGVFLLRYRIA